MNLLEGLARKVRGLRERQNLTKRETAERAGLSLRFYNSLESGDANISVTRLAAVADVFGITLEGLFRREVRPVALLGLRGAGKSTIGPKLAKSLGCPFVELDKHIERDAGLTLTEIFNVHGEPYYRKLESDCLRELFGSGEPCVIETPGGVVRNDEAFSGIRSTCTTVWLRAKPEDHMKRVYLQGDRRPMLNRDNAMEELRNILRDRASLYEQADISINTSSHSVSESVKLIRGELVKRGWEK